MLKTLEAQYDRNHKTSLFSKIESAQTYLSFAFAKDQQKFEIEHFQQKKLSTQQNYLKIFSKSNTIPSEMYLVEEKTQREPEEAALFNQYFSSIFTYSDYNADRQARHETFINTFRLSRPEVRDVLLNLDKKKEKDPDRIDNALLCKLAEYLNVSIHLILNTIVFKFHFPTFCKNTRANTNFQRTREATDF